MPNDLVRWNDLLNYFSTVNPRTVDHVLETRCTAKVQFNGMIFEIRPRPGHPHAVDIYGPAILFPSECPVVVL